MGRARGGITLAAGNRRRPQGYTHASAQERSLAVSFYDYTRSISKTAERFGRSTGTIANWLKAAGVEATGHRVPPEQMQVTRRLYESGLETAEISARQEIDVSVVRERLRKMGVVLRPKEGKKLDPREVEKTVALAEQGLSTQQAADRLGISRSSVKRRLRGAGVPAPEREAPKLGGVNAARAVELFHAGVSYPTAAEELGVHVNTLQSFYRARGLRRGSAGVPPPPAQAVIVGESADLALELFRSDLSYPVIAAELGVHVATLSRFYASCGLRRK